MSKLQDEYILKLQKGFDKLKTENSKLKVKIEDLEEVERKLGFYKKIKRKNLLGD